MYLIERARTVMVRSSVVNAAMQTLFLPLRVREMDIVGEEGLPTKSRSLMRRIVQRHYSIFAIEAFKYFVFAGFVPFIKKRVKVSTLGCDDYEGELEEVWAEVPVVPEYGACEYVFERTPEGITSITGQLTDSSKLRVYILRSSLYRGPSSYRNELATPCGALILAFEALQKYEKFKMTAATNLSVPGVWIERNLPAAAYVDEQMQGAYAEMISENDPTATYPYKRNRYEDEEIDTPVPIADIRLALEGGKAVDAGAAAHTLPRFHRIGNQPRLPQMVDLDPMYREYERDVANLFDIPLSTITGTVTNQRRDKDDRTKLITSVTRVCDDLKATLSSVAEIIYGSRYDFNIPMAIGTDVETLILGKEHGVLSDEGFAEEYRIVTGVAHSSLKKMDDQKATNQEQPDLLVKRKKRRRPV